LVPEAYKMVEFVLEVEILSDGDMIRLRGELRPMIASNSAQRVAESEWHITKETLSPGTFHPRLD
jgi:hypothetical protein